ncbi:MAG: HNH endonuclease [Herbinix sp.]|nr:HNH endonuclease [Herbinix sp.]
MPNYSILHSFYTSKRWRKFRKAIIAERKPICEICGKIIINSIDCEVDHYPIELTVNNVNDANISLNPLNVRIIDHDCHNKRHNRFGKISRQVYIVYGPPMSGKASYVLNNIQRGDLVVDMDKLYSAISFREIYDNPEQLKYNVFILRDLLIDNIKTRYGKWVNAWIIGGYPEKYKREQLADELNAELIYIEMDKEECMKRLEADQDRKTRYIEWEGYIDKWFERYQT